MNAARKAWGRMLLASVLAANIASGGPPESPGDAYRRGDYAKTIKLLKPQAEAGGIDAQIMLGQMYLKGEGVKADVTRAIAWIRKAADQGSPIAAYDLGVFSSTGVGGPQDSRAAAVWYRKAAHQGYPDAAFNLAFLYHEGRGIERSDAMALNWIDAGIKYLRPATGQDLRSRFAALRESIVASMPPGQIGDASRLVSPDGPVILARIRNKEGLEDKALKEYPIGLQHLGRGGRVIVLLRVRADGTVGDGMIETSSGYPQLDAATLRLLATVEVDPRRIDGQPTESWQIMRWSWGATEEPWNSFSSLNALPR